MPLLNPVVKSVGKAPFYPYEIGQSCRFNDDDLAHLTRTFGAGGDRRTWSYSFHAKRADLVRGRVFGSDDGATSQNSLYLRFETTGELRLNGELNNVNGPVIQTASQFHDPSAFYHFVVAFDSTETLSADRLKIWCNGVLQELVTTTAVTLNVEHWINHNGDPHYTGGSSQLTQMFDGYLAKNEFVGGLALTANDFGEFKNDVWIPKEYTGSYGTNGFHLDFADNSDIGNDVSGNNNDWTSVNLVSSDIVSDSPTQNWCTLNSVDPRTTGTLSNGNLVVSAGVATVTNRPSSGQWYYEKDGVGVTYDADISGQFDPELTAGSYNFGQLPWSDTGPTGSEKAISCPNLPEPTYIDGEELLVTVVDTETNIASSLTSARSSYSNYVDILKNLDNPETWAWRFSHDSGNEYAVATVATYQADRALSGSDRWVGYSVRIGSGFGTASGSESHTNGIATTVTHNLNEERGFILLFPRSGGEVLSYHPELTAGNLLYLTGTDAEFLSSIITNVTANSFDIGSSAATGTYDYLIITESDLVNLGVYEGNGNADGVFVYSDVLPQLFLSKRKDSATGGNWRVLDDTRYDYNFDDPPRIFPDSNSGEQSNLRAQDLLSNGSKLRTNNSGMNANGGDYVFVNIGRTPFKYANAR